MELYLYLRYRQYFIAFALKSIEFIDLWRQEFRKIKDPWRQSFAKTKLFWCLESKIFRSKNRCRQEL